MFEDDKRVYSEITINTAEYKELLLKALKFDLLKTKAKKSDYVWKTDFECAVFELDERNAENAVE